MGEMTINPSEYGIITLRSVGPGPGRGHKGEPGKGLQTIERLNMVEALEDPRFSELAEQVKNRLISIVRSYMRAGILSLEEITG